MNLQNISSEIQELKNLVTQQTEKPLCLDEAAAYLNIKKSYLYKLTHLKILPFFKPNGKKIYFSKSELDKWIMRNPVKSQEQIEQDADSFITRSNK